MELSAETLRALADGGLPVTAVYGSPYPESTAVIPDAARHDPVLGGHRVGRHDAHGGLAGTGTVGWVVRDSRTGKPIAIGNAHVLGGTPGSPPSAAGDVIQQPAPSSPERLGELLRWTFGQRVIDVDLWYPGETPTVPGRTPATPAQWWSTRTTRSSATRAMTPPVTPVTSRRWRPRSESPCEMRVM